MTDVHSITGAHAEHLEFAWDLMAAWLEDSESPETYRMVRLATLEFMPADVVMAMAGVIAGLIEGLAENFGLSAQEELNLLRGCTRPTEGNHI